MYSETQTSQTNAIHTIHVHSAVAVISYEEAAYTVVEGRTVDVCISPVSEELEAVITLQLSTVDSSAVEGTNILN